MRGNTSISLALSAALLSTTAAAASSARDREPPLFRGAVGQFTLVHPVESAPDLPFHTLAGAPVRLSSFRGRVVVLNFWATWCAPCVSELGRLASLAALEPRDIVVLAVALDSPGRGSVAAFEAAHPEPHLGIYVDPDPRLASLRRPRDDKAIYVWALPTTYIIDRQGRIRGYLAGPADWSSPEATRLMQFFVEGRGRNGVEATP